MLFRGDTVEFSLHIDAPIKGEAFLRTTLGAGKPHRSEIIDSVEKNEPARGLDWRDLPMRKTSDSSFSISIALTEVGHFEAKCFFFPSDGSAPKWVNGENVHINVEPAEYCSANSVYCAFVRQFGAAKTLPQRNDEDYYIRNIPRLDQEGYAVIPPSGTFDDLAAELDFIFDTLKCRILHLLPVNPTPTVFARMGRYGSPYASLDYTAVDPAMAVFDKKRTPSQQFLDLIDKVHMHNAKVFLDIAINHTGWAAKIHETHPEWLIRDENGEIVSPGAWGIVWGDLTELNHEIPELWSYFADVFLTWCERGIDGFRCDAGYMIPTPAWEYIIAKVRLAFPDTIFLLEGLGGDPKITRDLLNKANMNWAYSELFQNYSKAEITNYIAASADIARSDGVMIHYAETHDNNRLAATSLPYAKMRTTISALLSFNGAFGFANGVEWFATEKIDVHEACGLNWGAGTNQVAHIARLNAILAIHPAFHKNATISFLDSAGTAPEYDNDTLAFSRTPADGTRPLVAVCNLNHEKQTRVFWPNNDFDYSAAVDLISGDEPQIEIKGDRVSALLEPGEAMLLAENNEFLDAIDNYAKTNQRPPDSVVHQKAKAIVMDMVTSYLGSVELPPNGLPTDTLTNALLESPERFPEFLAEHLEQSSPSAPEIPITRWICPEDLKRHVMLPPKHALLLTAPARFRLQIKFDPGQKLHPGGQGYDYEHTSNSLYGAGPNAINTVQYDSIPDASGRHFLLLPPLNTPDKHLWLTLNLSLFGTSGLQREQARVLLLSNGNEPVQPHLRKREIRDANPIFLDTNGRGATCRLPVAWSGQASKYDAIISANLHPEYPVDRWIMWTGCRMWIVNQAHSQEFSSATVQDFSILPDGKGLWRFLLPAGNGLFVKFAVTASMEQGRNAADIAFERLRATDHDNDLPDTTPVKLVIRPDLENRSFHDVTKAMGKLEKTWPGAVTPQKHSFTFAPDGPASLTLALSATPKQADTTFHNTSEWRYNVFHHIEAERGLEPCCDLFSPGYFAVELHGAETALLRGEIQPKNPSKAASKLAAESANSATSASATSERHASHSPISFPFILQRAMRQFIVKRNNLKTVIAGYPWFLDWGRDTLICLRGMVAAGMMDESKDIILAFAEFAENGTLPNIIHGAEAGNRDTSDAPLWLFTACRDFHDHFPLVNLLDTEVPGKNKPLVEILEEIAENYIAGTPNGIKMDPETSLVFSPPHFTWMDTNFPAGTPREGYPVEIQALWFAALSFLAEITGKPKWSGLAENVRKSFLDLFPLPESGLADCLLAKPGAPATRATQDDAIRPNQLLAITLGLVENREIRAAILDATEQLLVPGAIRSLADKPVSVPLPIKNQHGDLLNDPNHPYQGVYVGDEDSKRKPAYHNGTAWTWIFPSYPEALFIHEGDNGRETAKAILSSSKTLLNAGCVGHIPEILDGDAPHTPRGCDAQAWGVTELYRVWNLLK